MSQTTPTMDKADKCLQTLKMFVFTRPFPCEEMMECMIRMSSTFSKELIKERKMKQYKIYDFWSMNHQIFKKYLFFRFCIFFC